MVAPNNKLRVKRRARNVAGLVYSVYAPSASKRKVAQVAGREARRMIYAPNSGKVIARVNPFFWLMSGIRGAVDTVNDANSFLRARRKGSSVKFSDFVKGTRHNFSAPNMSGAWFYNPLLRIGLITKKTVTTPALAHELTHSLRGFRMTNFYDANSIDRYFTLADSFSQGKMDPKELADLKARAKKLDFFPKDVSNIKEMYARNFTNRLRTFLKFAAIDEHSKFLKEPGTIAGGHSAGRIAFIADLHFGKPFMGLMILKSLGEGKSFEEAIADANAGLNDSMLQKVYDLNPVMTRYYSRIIARARV